MKRVLILGNSNVRLKYRSYIDNWKDEIWVCNTAFIEYKSLPRLDVVGTVHPNNAIKALEFKNKNNLSYKILSSNVQDYPGIDNFIKWRGWSTGNELIHEAFLKGYGRINLLGFDFGVGGDIHQPGKKLVGSNFKKQYDRIVTEFDDRKIHIVNPIQYKKDDINPADQKNMEDLFVNKEITDNIDKDFSNKIKHIKNVLIIGNSPSLLEKEYGKLIDNYDYVVRLNDYEVKGYESNVGTKTDCWFTGGGHKTSIKNRKVDNTDYVICPGVTQYRIAEKFIIEKVKQNLGIFNTDLKILNKKLVNQMHSIAKLDYASTGLMAIVYFSHILKKNVSIIGFDFFQSYNHHYYDNRKTTISSAHKFDQEKAFIDKAIKYGRIKVLHQTELPSKSSIDSINVKNNINLKKTALFSLVTDDFIEPFEVFIKSLVYNNPWFNLDYLILDTGLSSKSKRELKKIYPKVKFVTVKNKALYKDVDMSKTPECLQPTFYKLELFNQKNYDKLIMIDIDMVVTGDISGLIFDKREGIFGCKCYNENNHTLSPMINTGVVAVTKQYLNDHTYRQILNFVKDKKYNLPDQKAINFFFKDKIQPLAKKYNVEKRMFYNTNKEIAVPEDDIRIYHLVGFKCWNTHLPVPDKEKRYKQVEKIWFDYRDKIKRGEM
jgi:lipopolysaccharide biosynthesis glycosyltransferase